MQVGIIWGMELELAGMRDRRGFPGHSGSIQHSSFVDWKAASFHLSVCVTKGDKHRDVHPTRL